MSTDVLRDYYGTPVCFIDGRTVETIPIACGVPVLPQSRCVAHGQPVGDAGGHVAHACVAGRQPSKEIAA